MDGEDCGLFGKGPSTTTGVDTGDAAGFRVCEPTLRGIDGAIVGGSEGSCTCGDDFGTRVPFSSLSFCFPSSDIAESVKCDKLSNTRTETNWHVATYRDSVFHCGNSGNHRRCQQFHDLSFYFWVCSRFLSYRFSPPIASPSSSCLSRIF